MATAFAGPTRPRRAFRRSAPRAAPSSRSARMSGGRGAASTGTATRRPTTASGTPPPSSWTRPRREPPDPDGDGGAPGVDPPPPRGTDGRGGRLVLDPERGEGRGPAVHPLVDRAGREGAASLGARREDDPGGRPVVPELQAAGPEEAVK